MKLNDAGFGDTSPTATATYSANVPVPTNGLAETPYTASPGANPSTPGPTRSTTPARSIPGVRGRRWSM